MSAASAILANVERLARERRSAAVARVAAGDARRAKLRDEQLKERDEQQQRSSASKRAPPATKKLQRPSRERSGNASAKRIASLLRKEKEAQTVRWLSSTIIYHEAVRSSPSRPDDTASDALRPLYRTR
tara:strand:- start:1517 stop:1903 length:387 start_codon:yes stop_codon:yes gene_type:complete